MAKILERYNGCTYGALEPGQTENVTQSNYQEYLKLKEKVEILQRSQRQCHGEDLGGLGEKELEQLEHQLDSALKQIRSIKMQYMLNQLSELQGKEEILMETNRNLRRRLDESTSTIQSSLETGEQSTFYNYPPPPRSGGFFEPLQCSSSSLQIGYNHTVSDQANATAPAPNDSSLVGCFDLIALNNL